MPEIISNPYYQEEEKIPLRKKLSDDDIIDKFDNMFKQEKSYYDVSLIKDEGENDNSGVLAAFDNISENPKYQSKAYKIADQLSRSLPNKAFAQEVAKYVPAEERDNVLNAVSELAGKRRKWAETGTPGRMIGSAIGSLIDVVGTGKRLLSTEPNDKEQIKFAKRLEMVWKNSDPIKNPDAPWYDPRELAVGASEMAGPIVFAGGAGKIAQSAAKGLGATEKLASGIGKASMAGSFYPGMREETYDTLLEQGVAPNTAKWAASTSAGIGSLLFAGVAKKLLPKSLTQEAFQKEFSSSLVKQYAKNSLIHGPVLMSSQKAIDEAIQDVAKGKDPDFLKYAQEAVINYPKLAGTMAVAGIPGMAIDAVSKEQPVSRLEQVKQERISNEINQAIEKNIIPSREQVKNWGIKVEGKNNSANRYAAIRNFANQYQKEKAAAGFYLGEDALNTALSDVQKLRPEGMQQYAESKINQLTGKEDVIKKETEVLDKAEGILPTEVQQEVIKEPVLETPKEEVSTEPNIPIEKEVKPQENDITSIKNDVVNRLRLQRGEQKQPSPETQHDEELLGKAAEMIQKDSSYPERLLLDIKESKRTPNKEEVAVLQLQYRHANNALKTSNENLIKANKSNDPVEVERAQNEANLVLRQVQNIEEVTKPMKSEMGRAFRALKLEMLEDFSPASMVSRASIAKGSKPLTTEEVAKINEMSKRISDLETQLTDFQKSREQTNVIEELAPKKTVKKTSAEKIAAKKKVQDAWDEFGKVATGKLFANPLDPELIIAAGKVIKAYVDLGVTTFSEFYAGMSNKFGKDKAEKSKEILFAAWNKAKENKEIPELKIDIEKPSDISKTARKISSSLIENGVTDWPEIRDSVYNELKQFKQDITKEQVSDAIMRRGEYFQEVKPTKPESYQKGLLKRLAEYKRRNYEGDYEKNIKKNRILDNKELELQFQLAKEKAKARSNEYKIEQSQKSVVSKVLDIPREAVRTQRAILSSYDVSAVFRQAGIAAFGHPVLVAKETVPMFKSLVSEKQFFKVMQEIENRPNNKNGNYKYLGLTTTEGRLEQMEEMFMGEFARKYLPGIKQSERAYISVLNKLRADLLDGFISSMPEGKVTDRDLKALSNYVNVATGRGRLSVLGKSFESAALPAADVLFSPRLTMSRFQWLTLQPLFFKSSWQAKKIIALEYARALSGIGTFIAAASIMGANMETDPRSSDFLKIKIGNTLIDPFAGLSQTTVLLSRLITGKTKAKTGEIIPIRGENVPYKGDTTTTVIGRFLRSKLSPGLGTAIDIQQGENVVGEKVTPGSVVTSSATPLSMRDIYETMKEQGVPKGIAIGLLSMFGIGVQNYQQAKPGDFAEKITKHPKLISINKKTRKVSDYSEDVSNIIKQSRKQGMSVGDLETGLVQKLKEEGASSNQIQEQKKRLRKRLAEQK